MEWKGDREMVDLIKFQTPGLIVSNILRKLPFVHQFTEGHISSTVILGGFIFIPPPTRVVDEIYHKTMEVPTIKMRGNKVQYMGYRAPRIYIEGEWVYESNDFIADFASLFGAERGWQFAEKFLLPEDYKNLLRKVIKAWGGKGMPFISTVNPQWRWVVVESEQYYAVEGRPYDIGYKLTLIQQKTYGVP